MKQPHLTTSVPDTLPNILWDTLTDTPTRLLSAPTSSNLYP